MARAGRRRARAVRRVRERHAYVADVWRIRIFERDKWICKLCHEPVARSEAVPHWWAPTLDHIIALSKGGTHEPANVQCAHFLCNSLKSDGEGGEQLLLRLRELICRSPLSSSPPGAMRDPGR